MSEKERAEFAERLREIGRAMKLPAFDRGDPGGYRDREKEELIHKQIVDAKRQGR